MTYTIHHSRVMPSCVEILIFVIFLSPPIFGVFRRSYPPRLLLTQTTAHSPQGLLSGMNTFLDLLRITFRRDPTNFRPRINKLDSVKDREQKASGNFFFMDSSD